MILDMLTILLWGNEIKFILFIQALREVMDVPNRMHRNGIERPPRSNRGGMQQLWQIICMPHRRR